MHGSVKLHHCVCCAKWDCSVSVIFAGSIYELLVYDILVSVTEIILICVIIGDVLITAPCIFCKYGAYICKTLTPFQGKYLTYSGVPSNFVWEGFNKFCWGQRTENGDLGVVAPYPLVKGSGGSCNLVQEIPFHIVKVS